MSGGMEATDADLDAAEYVLGVLSPAEARVLEARALDDAGLSASIAAWEARLGPMAALVPAVEPPTVLWRRLALATGIDSVIVAPRRRGTGFWRATTLGSMAIAASLALLLYTRSLTPPEPLMAALSPVGGPGATFLVRVDAAGVATVVALGAADVPQGRSLELWALQKGSSVPVSMGLLPAEGRGQLTIAVPQGTQLLVSQEPAGGSPTKLPTGPVVYSGQLTGI